MLDHLSNYPSPNLTEAVSEVNKSIQLKVFVADEARNYMNTKKIKSGHIL